MERTKEELLMLISQMEATLDNLPFNVWCKDINGKYVVANQSFANETAHSKDDIIGKTCYDLFPKDFADLYNAKDQSVMTTGFTESFEAKLEDKIYREFKKPVRDASDNIIGITGYSWDINQDKKIQDALNESERSKGVLLANLPGMAYRSDFEYDLSMLFVSEGCYNLTGYTAEELLRKTPSYYDLILPGYKQTLLKKWKEALPSNCFTTDEYPIMTASGEVKWVWEQYQEVYDENQNAIATEGLIIDVTARKLAEEKITYLSYHDQLTGLYNRRFYEEECRRLDNPRNLPITVVMADINGLKLVNDAFGHLAGDELIRKMADTFRRECRADDIIARIGGDEFVILMPGTDAKKAKKIIERISAAIALENIGDIVCSASFGWKTKRRSEDVLQQIYSMAENQMYRHKLSESQVARDDTIKAAAKKLYEKDAGAQRHSERVSELCVEIGEAMDMSQADLNELRAAGLLHDIGKAGINVKLLNKQEQLAPAEILILKRHPEIGYQILRSVNEFASIAETVLCHHERVDGKGYPRKLKGKKIPLFARIIRVADAYESMTDPKGERKLTPIEATEELKKKADTEFDGAIVKIFVAKVLSEDHSA